MRWLALFVAVVAIGLAVERIPAVRSWQKRRQDLYLQRMQRRGHITHLALNVALFAGAYVAFRAGHIAAFRLGWVTTPGSTTWSDVISSAILPGIILGQMEWSRVQRRLSRELGYDATMI